MIDAYLFKDCPCREAFCKMLEDILDTGGGEILLMVYSGGFSGPVDTTTPNPTEDYIEEHMEDKYHIYQNPGFAKHVYFQARQYAEERLGLKDIARNDDPVHGLEELLAVCKGFLPEVKGAGDEPNGAGQAGETPATPAPSEHTMSTPDDHTDRGPVSGDDENDAQTPEERDPFLWKVTPLLCSVTKLAESGIKVANAIGRNLYKGKPEADWPEEIRVLKEKSAGLQSWKEWLAAKIGTEGSAPYCPRADLWLRWTGDVTYIRIDFLSGLGEALTKLKDSNYDRYRREIEPLETLFVEVTAYLDNVDRESQPSGTTKELEGADPAEATEPARDGHNYCPVALSKKEIGVAFGLPADNDAEKLNALCRTTGIYLQKLNRSRYLVALDTLSEMYLERLKKHLHYHHSVDL